jgi:hypothetical protein
MDPEHRHGLNNGRLFHYDSGFGFWKPEGERKIANKRDLKIPDGVTKAFKPLRNDRRQPTTPGGNKVRIGLQTTTRIRAKDAPPIRLTPPLLDLDTRDIPPPPLRRCHWHYRGRSTWVSISVSCCRWLIVMGIPLGFFVLVLGAWLLAARFVRRCSLRDHK